MRWQDVQHDLDIIVKGAFNCCQAVLPAMVERRFGRIVNLSTVAVENPPVGHSRYVVAKSALLGLTRSLAVEYAAHGICVNANATPCDTAKGKQHGKLTPVDSPMERNL